MKITLKSELPSIVCLAAMAAMLALAWPSAPERIPVHWNMRGDIDRYGTRFEGLALLPIIGVAIYLLLRFLPLADPRRANYAGFATAYDVIRHGALVLAAGLLAATWVSYVTWRDDPRRETPNDAARR